MVTYVLLEWQPRLPLATWFEGLNASAAAKVTAALYQLAANNRPGVKGVGGGVYERKIDYGRRRKVTAKG